jgi:hypothetical protein
MYFGTSVSFLKSLLNSGIFHKKFLDCNIKSWCAAILCMFTLLFLLGCENTRHSVGVTAKPFAKGDKMEDSVKLNYKIIFGKVRPKEDDDD